MILKRIVYVEMMAHVRSALTMLLAFLWIDDVSCGSNISVSPQNFLDWISDMPNEVTEWKRLDINLSGDSKILPWYVQGTLVRNGGGLWSVGNELYSHLFDGLAKVSAWRIKADTDGGNTTIFYRNQFIQSKMYKKSIKQQRFPVALSVGPILSKTNNLKPKAGALRFMKGLLLNQISFDNAPVNLWQFDPAGNTTGVPRNVAALTDVTCRAQLSLDDLSTVSTSGSIGIIDGLAGILFYETAHPMYSKTSDDTYNAAAIITLHGMKLVLVRESPTGKRVAVGSAIPNQPGTWYIHSLGVTDRHAVVIMMPIRSSITPKVLELGVLRSMEQVRYTEIFVFDLTNGSLVFQDQIEDKIFFYHTVSAAESFNAQGEREVSMRVCGSETPDYITGDNQFMRLERARSGIEFRNQIPKMGKFCDVTVNLDSKTVEVDWNVINEVQGFEMPTTRYSRSYGSEALAVANRHPRFVYAVGNYALGSKDYDDWGIFKFDMEGDGITRYFFRDSVYVSEPILVPNPKGSQEDDGVILSQIYDGRRRETGLLILNATTMDVLAEVWSGHRSPMDFHGTWIQSSIAS